MDKPVYDLDTLEPVKVEAPKADEPPKDEPKAAVDEPKDDEPADEPDDDTPADEPKKDDEPADEPVDEPTDEPKDDEPDDEPKDEPVQINDYLKGKYEEKYEIKSEEELDKTLENLDGILAMNDELIQKNKELTEQLAAKGEAKLTFKSEAQESLYNFVKDYDPSNIHTGITTWARLVGMDVEKEPAKLILEEQFILENPDLSRDDAQRKFARDFNRKYGAPVRDNFDTDAEFEDEKEGRELDLKTDAAKARKVLLEKQKEFKTAPPKTEDTKEEKVPAAVTSAIKKMSTDLDANFKDFSEFIFSPTADKADDFKFGLSKEQKAKVYNVMKPWIENPASYDSKGNFVAGDLMANVQAAAFTLFGLDLIEKAYKAGENKGTIKKADALAKRQPDRKAKTAADQFNGQMSEDQQWEMLAKKKKAAQKGR